MVAPDGGTPGVGLYEHAEAQPDQLAGIPGLTAGACSSTVSGSFRILELEQGTDGTASRLAADIRQRCGGDATELFAAVRYNSALPSVQHVPDRHEHSGDRRPRNRRDVDGRGVERHGAGRVPFPSVRHAAGHMDARARLEQRSRLSLDAEPWTNIGSYAVQVWARTAGSTVPYEGWRNSDTLIVAPVPLTIHDLQWDAARARAGEPLTLEAIAGGGTGDLEYRFVKFERAVGRWTVIREYGSSNRVEWTPEAAGDYDIQVWVREVGSAAAYDTWRSEPLRVK